MQHTSKLIIFVITFLALATNAHAQSPREQLNQMVQQLQQNPSNNALREKIIKLAPTLKPSPALPDEAERRMVRGAAAFKSATSVAGYQDAAKEFEQATLAAPWYGDAYFNLGVAQDKAENYEAALRSLKFAQMASPGSKEIKTLIFEVEYRNEKARSPQEQEAALIKSLNGAIFFRQSEGPGGGGEGQYQVSGTSVVYAYRYFHGNERLAACRNPFQLVQAGESCSNNPVTLSGRDFSSQGEDCKIISDGQSIVCNFYGEKRIYKRR